MLGGSISRKTSLKKLPRSLRCGSLSGNDISRILRRSLMRLRARALDRKESMRLGNIHVLSYFGQQWQMPILCLQGGVTLIALFALVLEQMSPIGSIERKSASILTRHLMQSGRVAGAAAGASKRTERC